ncbi:MAG: GyrI-like domain-containing protein [Bacteroidota bacterium]
MLIVLRRLSLLLVWLSAFACGPGAGEEVEIISKITEGGDTTSRTTSLKYLDTDLPERYYLVFRQELSMLDVNGFIGMESDILRKKVSEAGITPTGPWAVLTYEWDTERSWADVAVAIPVEKGTELAPYVTITLPATKAAGLLLKGSYDGLSAYHLALDQELKRLNLAPLYPSIEEYITGPSETKNEEEFQTLVLYPYKNAQ